MSLHQQPTLTCYRLYLPPSGLFAKYLTAVVNRLNSLSAMRIQEEGDAQHLFRIFAAMRKRRSRESNPLSFYRPQFSRLLPTVGVIGLTERVGFEPTHHLGPIWLATRPLGAWLEYLSSWWRRFQQFTAMIALPLACINWILFLGIFHIYPQYPAFARHQLLWMPRSFNLIRITKSSRNWRWFWFYEFNPLPYEKQDNSEISETHTNLFFSHFSICFLRDLI